MKKKLLLLTALAITSASSFGQVGVPFYEPFSYTSGGALVGQTLTASGLSSTWSQLSSTSTIDDIIVEDPWIGSLGLPSVNGQAVYVIGGNSDPVLYFTSQTSGTIYYSCLLQIDDFDSNATSVNTTTGYRLVNLVNSTGNAGACVNVRRSPNDVTKFNLGYANSDVVTEVVWGSTDYANGSQHLVVVSYLLDGSGTAKLWIDPTVSTVEPTTGYISSNTTNTKITTDFGGFSIQQSKNDNTPGTTVDELRVAKTWAQVVGQASLSVAQNEISGLSVYPNPVKEGVVYISTSSSDDLSVEVYDLLGKKLISSEVTSGFLNVSGLTKGVYVMKITEGSATSTKKLIIE